MGSTKGLQQIGPQAEQRQHQHRGARQPASAATASAADGVLRRLCVLRQQAINSSVLMSLP
ncbi:MAG: hypothetical protein R3E55_08040 [Burkholderiaceae bacterium]